MQLYFGDLPEWVECADLVLASDGPALFFVVFVHLVFVGEDLLESEWVSRMELLQRLLHIVELLQPQLPKHLLPLHLVDGWLVLDFLLQFDQVARVDNLLDLVLPDVAPVLLAQDLLRVRDLGRRPESFELDLGSGERLSRLLGLRRW